MCPQEDRRSPALLESVHTRMEADIQKRDASGQLMERFGLTYTSDGWEDCNSTPLTTVPTSWPTMVVSTCARLTQVV